MGIETLRPEDDFESFMAMMGGESAPEEDVKEDIEDVEDDIADEDNEDYDEDTAFRKAMGEDDEDSDDEDDEEDVDEDEDEDDDEEYEEDIVDVDFDTIITLPNGEQISIEDLHKGFAKSDEIKKREEELESRQTDYDSKFKDIDKMLDTAKLEADRVLEDFKGFDWQKLATEDPKEFANTKLFVEKYVARSKEIKEAQEARSAEKAEQEQQELQMKAKACVDILKTDIPEWNSDLYGEILQHAVDKLGMEADAAKGLVDPSTIKAIYRSLQLDKGTTKAKAKLKRVGSPKKVAKSGAKKASKTTKSKSPYVNESQEFDFFKTII